MAALTNISWPSQLRVHHIEQVVGGIAAVSATLISGWHIRSHVQLNRTALWKYTMRILLIVPIYAINAWACLMLETSVYPELLTFFRESFESLAIFSFMLFVVTYLGGPVPLAKHLISRSQEPVQQIWPLRLLLPAYQPGYSFVSSMLIGILQYPALMLFVLACNVMMFGVELTSTAADESEGYAFVWQLKAICKYVKCISCAVAMYHLGMFYHETMEQLAPLRPILKFLSIKLIIFFTFWQEFIIFNLVRFGVIIKQDANARQNIWSQSDMADGLRDLLLCLEMFAFSLMHLKAYPPHEQNILVGVGNAEENASIGEPLPMTQLNSDSFRQDCRCCGGIELFGVPDMVAAIQDLNRRAKAASSDSPLGKSSSSARSARLSVSSSEDSLEDSAPGCCHRAESSSDSSSE